MSDTNHDVSELEVIWYYGIDEICLSPDAGGQHTPNLDDDTVRVEVRDIDGAGASNAVVLSVFETVDNPLLLVYTTPIKRSLFWVKSAT